MAAGLLTQGFVLTSRRWVAVLPAILVALIAAAGCGGSSAAPPTEPAASAPSPEAVLGGADKESKPDRVGDAVGQAPNGGKRGEAEPRPEDRGGSAKAHPKHPASPTHPAAKILEELVGRAPNSATGGISLSVQEARKVLKQLSEGKRSGGGLGKAIEHLLEGAEPASP